MPLSSDDYREGFSLRLRSALSKNNLPVDSGTVLQRLFNDCPSRGDGVTVGAARKWLLGQALPSRDKVAVLARALNVDPRWLLFGDEAPCRDDAATAPASMETLMLKITALPPDDRALVEGIVNVCLARKRA